MLDPPSKDALRGAILRQRGVFTDTQWRVEDADRTSWLLQALGHTPGTVALYASRPGEPGTREAISVLASSGWRVLLPRLRPVPDWACFAGWDRMRAGFAGIPEPTTTPLGAEAVRLADVVVVPCLAVDRDGTRLGTGGGWYDRALLLRRPGTRVWALARNTELVDHVPREHHDVAVEQTITEQGVYACGHASPLSIGKPWPGELS